MPNQSRGEAEIDPNFVEIIQVLNEHRISYWVCHGSLLGLIRDGALIPWDHDIDIAVWADEYEKENITTLIVSVGFRLKEDNVMGSLHFTKTGGRGVDINFYEDILKPVDKTSVLQEQKQK